MKNSSKNNYFGKNNNQYKKDSDSSSYTRNKNSSKKNDRFSSNFPNNKSKNNLNESDNKKSSFYPLKNRKSINKFNKDINRDDGIKNILSEENFLNNQNIEESFLGKRKVVSWMLRTWAQEFDMFL